MINENLWILDILAVLKHNRFMRARVIVLLSVLSLALCGCLAVGQIETRVVVGEDITEITATYHDISWDSADVNEGFNALIEEWKGDEALLSAAKEGRAVKSREVYLDHGILTGRIVQVARGPEAMDDLEKTETQWELVVDRNPQVPVKTNGTIVENKENADQVMIVWPLDTKEFYWVQAGTELGELARQNSSAMREKFQSYQRAQWRKKFKALLARFKHPRALFRTLKANLL